MVSSRSSQTAVATATKRVAPVVAATVVVAPAYAPENATATQRGKGFPTYVKVDATKRQFTWEEVAQHNTESSAWVYIGHTVYDITPWLSRHPGGKEILLLTAGRDVSDLFVTYHPFSDVAARTIEQYKIGEMLSTEFPQFKPDRGFYREARQVVGRYFKSNGLNHKDPRAGLWRLAVFIFGAALSYSVLCRADQYSMLVRIVAAVSFGVCQALPLLHTMHDASHLAIGSTPIWWRVIGRLCMDWFAGASMYSWYNQHTIGHHVYTNIMGADPDLPIADEGDIRRITPFQKWTGYYRWQHVYLMFLYGFLALKFRIQDVTDTIIAGTNGSIRVNAQSSSELFTQFVSKSFWIVCRILIPLFVCGVSHSVFWPTFILAEMITGYYLAFNFQVSHVSPEALWPDITKPMSDEWAIHQLQTSIDYGHGSSLIAMMSGALNYQSVHHLFPSISQYHYPAITPLVMQVAKKWKVNYNVMGSFTDAFVAHVDHLRQMGAEGKTVHSHDM